MQKLLVSGMADVFSLGMLSVVVQTLLDCGMTDVFGLGMADVFSLRMTASCYIIFIIYTYLHTHTHPFNYTYLYIRRRIKSCLTRTFDRDMLVPSIV
jgi:hypothetical protein